MKFHREAYPTVVFALILLVLFNVAMSRLFHEYTIVHRLLLLITSILYLAILYFFRVKTDVRPIGENVVVSPAYGKVVEIVEEVEPKFFKDERKRISIFMSPLNIHCNYVPIQGVVKMTDHYPGKYLVAFHPKSSELNEHTFSIIENNELILGIKQIAGFMARRIVPYLSSGETVQQNDELGFIKFGSRCDVFFPKGTTLNVKVGDNVKGGETILTTY